MELGISQNNSPVAGGTQQHPQSLRTSVNSKPVPSNFHRSRAFLFTHFPASAVVGILHVPGRPLVSLWDLSTFLAHFALSHSALMICCLAQVVSNRVNRAWTSVSGERELKEPRQDDQMKETSRQEKKVGKSFHPGYTQQTAWMSKAHAIKMWARYTPCQQSWVHKPHGLVLLGIGFSPHL